MANQIKRLLLATDFSAGADAAAEWAVTLAGQVGATLDVVTVIDTSPLTECYGDVTYRTQRIAEISLGARAQLEEFCARRLGDIKSVAMHVRDGNVFLEIIQAAQDLGSDLIVMGTHGRTGIAHLVIGSVAEKVVRSSPIPVVTVRKTD